MLGGVGGGRGFMLQGQHFSYVNISNHLTKKKKKRSLGCSILNSKEIMKGHFKGFFFFFLNFMWTGDRCLVYVNDHVIRRVLVCKYMVTF